MLSNQQTYHLAFFAPLLLLLVSNGPLHLHLHLGVVVLVPVPLVRDPLLRHLLVVARILCLVY